MCGRRGICTGRGWSYRRGSRRTASTLGLSCSRRRRSSADSSRRGGGEGHVADGAEEIVEGGRLFPRALVGVELVAEVAECLAEGLVGGEPGQVRVVEVAHQLAVGASGRWLAGHVVPSLRWLAGRGRRGDC